MFLAKVNFVTVVSFAPMLLLAMVASEISAAHLQSACFLLNKGCPQFPTIQDDTRGIGIVHHAAQNGCPYQSWWLHGDGDTFDITNMGTGRVLESNHKGEVFTSVYNGGLSQKWRWNGFMMYCLQNVATGLFLTIDSKVCAKLYYNGLDQQWERRHETAF